MKNNSLPIIGLIASLFAGIETGWCDGYKDARRELEHNSRPWFVEEHLSSAADQVQVIPNDLPQSVTFPELEDLFSNYHIQKKSSLDSVIQQVEPMLLSSESIEMQKLTAGERVEDVPGGVDTILTNDPNLLKAINTAYTRNPSVQAAYQAWQAALERYPQAIFLEGILRQYNSFTKQLDLLLMQSQPHKQWVDAEFPFPGVTALRGDIVQAEIEIAKQDFAIVLRDVLTAVKISFHQYLQLEETIAITREHQELLSQMLVVVSQKFQAGNTSYNDVIQARVALIELSDDLVTLQNRQQTVLARLNTLMHRSPQTAIGNVKIYQHHSSHLHFTPLYDMAVQKRQEIKKTGFQLQRITWMIEMARIKNRPEPTLGASYFQDRSALLAGSVKDRKPFQSVPMQSLRPWFGQREAFIAEMVKRKQEMQHKLDSMVDQTKYEINEAYFQFDKALRESNLYRTTLLDDARQSLEVAETDYVGARIDFLDYFDAQQTWLEFNLAYVKAKHDVEIAIAELEQVIGTSRSHFLHNNPQ